MSHPAAQALVRRLVTEARMSPKVISEALGDRVSGRTLHRWLKGESGPGNQSDLAALQGLVDSLLPHPPPAADTGNTVDDFDYDQEEYEDA